MKKQIIFSENAPAPIGPYSQAVQAGNMIFVSGQIAGPKDDLKEETRGVMENLGHVLRAAGSDFSRIVKASIFFVSEKENFDMGRFGEINEVYGSYFESEPPARETVQVAALPKNVNVEISVIALA
ncbi:MAG: RidA family protein [Bacteroidia bacterium]|nr:RidA family protein [Bacteroidia bacterium]